MKDFLGYIDDGSGIEYTEKYQTRSGFGSRDRRTGSGEVCPLRCRQRLKHNLFLKHMASHFRLGKRRGGFSAPRAGEAYICRVRHTDGRARKFKDRRKYNKHLKDHDAAQLLAANVPVWKLDHLRDKKSTQEVVLAWALAKGVVRRQEYKPIDARQHQLASVGETD